MTLHVQQVKTGQAFRAGAQAIRVPLMSKASQALLSQISKAGDWKSVQQLYSGYTGHETEIFNAVLHRAIKCRKFSRGLAIYEQACSRNVTKSFPTFRHAMKIHATLGHQGAVQQVYEEALETCGFDGLLAAARIDAAAEVGDVVTAAQVLDNLTRVHVTKVKVHHITSAIRACWRADGLRHRVAEYLFQRMLDLQLSPNMGTYTCLMRAYTTAPLETITAAYAHLKLSNLRIYTAFTEVYLSAVLQRPGDGSMLSDLRTRSFERREAARAALSDFMADGVKLTGLGKAIHNGLRRLDRVEFPASASAVGKENGPCLELGGSEDLVSRLILVISRVII